MYNVSLFGYFNSKAGEIGRDWVVEDFKSVEMRGPKRWQLSDHYSIDSDFHPGTFEYGKTKGRGKSMDQKGGYFAIIIQTTSEAANVEILEDFQPAEMRLEWSTRYL
jgi:hypothetical protein